MPKTAFELLMIIVLTAILAAVAGASFSESGQPNQETVRLKTLSKECVKICPHGVAKFEIQYSNSTCECRP